MAPGVPGPAAGGPAIAAGTGKPTGFGAAMPPGAPGKGAAAGPGTGAPGPPPCFLRPKRALRSVMSLGPCLLSAKGLLHVPLCRPLLGFREHSGAIGAADSQGNPSQASLRSSKTEARAATTASQLGKSYGFERRTVKHAIHFSLPSEIAVRADPNRRRFRPGPIVCVGAGEPAARCVSRRRRTSSRRDHERLFTRRSAAT